jgi:hypothetical protein
VQIASYNSHSASFGPSAVRVNTETVYAGRSEADLVMASTVHLWVPVQVTGLPNYQELTLSHAMAVYLLTSLLPASTV